MLCRLSLNFDLLMFILYVLASRFRKVGGGVTLHAFDVTTLPEIAVNLEVRKV